MGGGTATGVNKDVRIGGGCSVRPGGRNRPPAMNAAQPRPTPPNPTRAAQRVRDNFEVKIGGPSGARKVWIHTVVEAAAPNGKQRAIQTYTTTAHVRDF